MNESEIIFFQLLLSDKTTDSIAVLDSFDLRANEIISGIDHLKTYKDIIVTNCGNEYNIVIKKRGDELTKLKGLEKKIDAKTKTYARLNQVY